MVSAAVDTDEALEALLFPVDAMVACSAAASGASAASNNAVRTPLAARLTSASETTLLDGRKALFDRAKVGLAAEASADESDCLTAGSDATDAGVTASEVAAVTDPALSCVVWGCSPAPRRADPHAPQD